MEKRTISLGLAATLVLYFTTNILLKAHERLTEIMDTDPSSFFWPIFKSLQEPIAVLPWLIPGALVGFLCKNHPIKHGALTGAIYGAIIGFLGVIIASAQAYDTSDKITHLSCALIFSTKSAFLFALAAPLGHHMASQRRVL